MLRHARRVVVLVAGGTILGLGLALLVLPGPAFLVVPLGLAILALEFAWARRLLRRLKAYLAYTARADPSDVTGSLAQGKRSSRPPAI